MAHKELAQWPTVITIDVRHGDRVTHLRRNMVLGTRTPRPQDIHPELEGVEISPIKPAGTGRNRSRFRATISDQVCQTSEQHRVVCDIFTRAFGFRRSRRTSQSR